MNKTTAQQLVLAYAEVLATLKRIRKRQELVGNKEYNSNPDAFDDFRYFGDMLENSLDSIEHRLSDAQCLVTGTVNKR